MTTSTSRPRSLDRNEPHRREAPTVETLDTLSLRVLQVSLSMLAIAMPLISVAIVIGSLMAGTLTRSVWLPASAMIVFPILRVVSPRLGFRRAAFGLVTLLALSAFMLATRGGLTVGYAALCVMIIQFAALFFRRRGAVLALVAIGVLHLLAWFIVKNDIGPPLTLALWNPLSNAMWLRHLIILTLLGLVIAIGQLYVIEHLAQSLSVHRQMAAREKAQRLALEEAERIQAHEREQRAQAQHALERSRRIEALARVAGGVAHDFNNALTIILGAAAAAKDDAHSPDEVEAHMDGITDAARHAAALTNQLLTLGRQRLSTPTNLSVNALLERIRPAFAHVLPADTLLSVEASADDVTIHVDETAIDRALLNLVLNARDAMPRGGVITIKAHREVISEHDRLPAGPMLALQVHDNGVGMDAETIEHIFDPFFTTKGDKGTGLGLASVYAFAEEAGGTIDVQSELDCGTTFTMWLPAAESGAAVDRAMTATPVEETRTPGGRILIVEDIDGVRQMMRRILTSRGFDIVEANNGDAALMAIEHDPSFVLMCIDGVMPGLSTAETIERARLLSPQMRVIVCSGHVQEELLRRGIETGRYELLSKPFSPRELTERISRVLTKV